MAITNGYCTLAEFKAYAAITSSNAGDDAVIEDIIEGASREIDGFCGRFFFQSATTKFYISETGEYIHTDDLYTATGLTVEIDNNGDGVYETQFTASDYNLIPYNPTPFPYHGIEATTINGLQFSKLKKGNKITGSFGWNAVPDDIKQACLIASQAEYKRRFGEGISSVTTITSAGVVIAPQGLPTAAAQKILRYRRLT